MPTRVARRHASLKMTVPHDSASAFPIVPVLGRDSFWAAVFCCFELVAFLFWSDLDKFQRKGWFLLRVGAGAEECLTTMTVAKVVGKDVAREIARGGGYGNFVPWLMAMADPDEEWWKRFRRSPKRSGEVSQAAFLLK